jgi:hypothetical protein
MLPASTTALDLPGCVIGAGECVFGEFGRTLLWGVRYALVDEPGPTPLPEARLCVVGRDRW